MANSFVSVVIPTYNMDRYLEESVRSVLGQTYDSLEVIVVDDGSCDNTKTVMERLMSEDRRVRYHWKPNGGEAHTRNAGLKLTTGDFIAFNDADDVWYPTKLEKQMKLFEHSPSPDIVLTDRDLIDEEGRIFDTGYRIPLHRGERLYKKLLIQNFVPMSSPVMRRAVYEKVQGFDERLRYGTDRDFWLRASIHFRFDFVAECLEGHRKWGGQMTSNVVGFAESGIKIVEGFLQANKELIDNQLVRRALCAAYHRRGEAYSANGNVLLALRDFLTAIKNQPFHVPSFKSAVKAVLRMR